MYCSAGNASLSTFTRRVSIDYQLVLIQELLAGGFAETEEHHSGTFPLATPF